MNIDFEGFKFLGYYRYLDTSLQSHLGVFYISVENPAMDYFVLPLVLKTTVINAEKESEQSKNFGPLTKHLPQVVLYLSSGLYVTSRTKLSPVYVVDIVCFLRNSIMFCAGTSDVYGFQYAVSTTGIVEELSYPNDFPLYNYSDIYFKLPSSIQDASFFSM